MDEIFGATRDPCRKTMQAKVSYRKKKLEHVLDDALANGLDKMSRFAGRLLTHYHKLFLFTRYPGLEPTNNAA